MRQCSDRFDEIKPQFDQVQRDYTFTIRGSDTGVDEGQTPRLHIILEEDTIQEWFSKWISAKETLLRDHIAQCDTDETLDVTCAVLAGKGLECTMLYSAMVKVLQEK